MKEILHTIEQWFRNIVCKEKIRGYKAMQDGKCLGFKYEVGKTYSIKGRLVLCNNGFHFCRNAHDTISYYTVCRKYELYEIETAGEVIHNYDKSCTSKIKIVKKLSDEEIEKVLRCKIRRDSEGNITQLISSDGYGFLYDEFDTGGNAAYRYYVDTESTYDGKRYVDINDCSFAEFAALVEKDKRKREKEKFLSTIMASSLTDKEKENLHMACGF